MFHRYSEHARQALFRARYEASCYGTAEIDDIHLLLGVLTADTALAERLGGLGVTTAKIRERLTRTCTNVTTTTVDLPLSRPARQALILTAEEADRVGSIEIEPSHLLTALTRAESSGTAEMLLAFGVRPERLREFLR